MDMNEHHVISKRLDEEYEVKIKSALNFVVPSFLPFLQLLMSNVGYEKFETNDDHPTLINFMHLCLLDTACLLENLRASIKEKLYDDEIMLLRLLERENYGRKDESDIDRALILFNVHFPEEIKQCMKKANFEISETRDNNICYVTFFSLAFKALTELFFKWNETNTQLHSHYENPILSISLSTMSMFSDGDLSFISDEISAFYVVAENKCFTTYFVCTSSQKFSLKVAKYELNIQTKSEKLNNELLIGDTLQDPAIRNPLRKISFQSREAILSDWAEGRPLSYFDIFSVQKFLIVSREIASAVLVMHRSHLMHLNLNCDHIILDENHNTVKIISCGSFAKFNLGKYLSVQELQQEDLRCLSPELFGRTGRKIDFRSDFYSMGVIFYKLLTGFYPFEHDDKLNLIHMHLMDNPKSVSSVNNEVPVVISKMISKLMSKDAEDRYQTAKGIVYDLDLMISEYSVNRKLTSIVLGQHDFHEELLLPQRIYGREAELEYFNSLFENRNPTSFEAVLIEGKAGVGKSKLIRSLYPLIKRHNGIFLAGKFDKLKTEPYSALLEAVRGFCDDLLLQEKKVRKKFMNVLKRAVGEEGRVLTDLVSNLHLIIGKQPPLSDSFGSEAKNRFNHVLLRFFKALCSADFPLVLLLDDFHWLDSDSLNFLSTLLSEKGIENIVLLCTYRDNEIGPGHPFLNFVKILERDHRNIHRINVKCLDFDTVIEMMSDTLRVLPYATNILSTLVYRITKGNPFFLHQTINSLYDDGFIFFCAETNEWKWDISSYNEKELEQDAISFLSEKIMKLEAKTIRVFKVASCLASPIPRKALSILMNDNQAIQNALATGMLVQSERSGDIHFMHDLIQQAAFALLPGDPRDVFLYIGSKLLSQFTEDELHQNIFMLVNLLQKAINIVQNPVEREKLIDVFIIAGEKAMLATAFEQALNYFLLARECLGNGYWQSNYNSALEIFNLSAKAAYSAGKYELMKSLIGEIFKNYSCSTHLAKSYSLNIRVNNDQFSFANAIVEANFILQKLGENLDFDTNEHDSISNVMNKAKLLSLQMTDDEIINMQEMKKEKFIYVMMILSDIFISTYFSSPQLLPMISARIVELSLEHGISIYACLGFCTFGSLLLIHGDPEEGYRFGKLSFKLMHKFGKKELLPRVSLFFYNQISPFNEPIQKSLDPMLKACKISREIGSQMDCFLSGCTYCKHSFLAGRSLAELLNEIEELIKLLPHFRRTVFFNTYHQATLHLMGRNIKTREKLMGDVFDPSQLNGISPDNLYVGLSAVISGFISYLFYDYSSAEIFVKKYRLINPNQRETCYPFCVFLEALVSLTFMKKEENCTRRASLIEKNISTLKKYALQAPENFLHKVHILEALRAAETGRIDIAEFHYSEAILLTGRNGFIHEKAILCENLGIIFLNIDPNKAKEFLLLSCNSYKIWGAEEKVNHLLEYYPSYLTRSSLNNMTTLVSSYVFDAKSQSSLSQLSLERSLQSVKYHNPGKRVRFS